MLYIPVTVSGSGSTQETSCVPLCYLSLHSIRGVGEGGGRGGNCPPPTFESWGAQPLQFFTSLCAVVIVWLYGDYSPIWFTSLFLSTLMHLLHLESLWLMFSGIGLEQEIQLRMHQNASQSILFSKIFWGSMPPHPPRLAVLCTPPS